VINISDALFFLMAIPNVIGLYILAPSIKKDLQSYLQDLKKDE
jgi:AGCS family alanine or glycine:cation symporter